MLYYSIIIIFLFLFYFGKAVNSQRVVNIDFLKARLAQQSQEILTKNMKESTLQDNNNFNNLLGISFDDIKSNINYFLNSNSLSKISSGFVIGFTSGYFLKRIASIIIFTVGGTIVIVQTLSYFNYISINTNKIKKDVYKCLDINRDGVTDADDIGIVKVRIMDILGQNLHIGGGLSAGLLLGILL